jgi:RNA-directed DNA polymerase
VNAESAERIATDPATVARHPFLPFIRYNVTTQKIQKRKGGGVVLKPPKVRPIAYAAHKDAHILGRYSAILCESYERALRERGLHEAVTAFRSLDHRRNIHFANDVFEFIRNRGERAVLATDISDYFGTIRHDKLKRSWCGLLSVARLPADHFAVFKAITEYSTVDRDELCNVLGLDPENPREDGRHRFCSAHVFRTVVRGNGLCVVNRRGFGIPQGSPISAVLSSSRTRCWSPISS